MFLSKYFIYVFVMSLSTYLIRAIPLVAINSKLKNPFIRSFLAYIPYTVLAAMTFPSILYSTPHLISAFLAFILALTLAFFKKGLVEVAVYSCACALITELACQYF